MEIDLNEISVFVEVVKAGSFSQAAKKLKMPNSTVSHKVSSLEKRLGLTLLQRTTRKLNITPAGQIYFKKCLNGFQEIETAEAEMASVQGEAQGLLRVTAPVELGGGVLPEIISDFTAQFPKVTVELILTERRVDLLSESVDLAIRAGELKDSSLIAKKIGLAYFALFASPRYLKQNAQPSHPRELNRHKCLAFSPLGTDSWRLVGAKGTLDVPIKTHVMANDLNMIKNLALNHNGIAFLPVHLCQSESGQNKLVRVLPDWRSTMSPIHFVYPAQKFVMPKLSEFMKFSFDKLKKSFEGGLL